MAKTRIRKLHLKVGITQEGNPVKEIGAERAPEEPETELAELKNSKLTPVGQKTRTV